MKYCFLTFLFIAIAYLANGQSPGNVWTLKQCIDTAVVNNIQLRKSNTNVQLSEVDLKQSKDNRIPSLNANASQNFSSGRSIDPFTNQYVTNNIFSNNFSLSSGLVLFNGFQNRNTIRQNSINTNAANYDALAIQNDVIVNVLNGYLQVLYAYEQVDLSFEQVNTVQKQLQQTQSLVRAGKKTITDLYKLEAQAASDSMNLVKAENNLRMAKVNLMQIMNIPVYDAFEVEQIKIENINLELPEESIQEIYAKALTVMPEIKSSELKKESSLIGLQIRKGGMSPRLSISGNIGTGYSSARDLVTYHVRSETIPIGYLQNNPSQVVVADQQIRTATSGAYPYFDQLNDNLSKSLSLNLSIPILNNRQVKNNIQRQKLQIQQADLDLENTKNGLRKEIEQAYTDVKNAKMNYEAARHQLKYAERAFKNIQSKYEMGLGTSVDLQMENNNYLKAKSDLLNAQYQYYFNLQLLEVYKGNQPGV